MNDDIQCPYCGHDIEICHDDGFGYEEDALHHYECDNCEKMFVFTTSISFYYHAEKADCLNGADHDMQPIIGAPEENFIGRYRCSVCYEEEDRDPEGRKEAMKKLYG